MGVWDPVSVEEIANATAAATSPVIMGYSIGNEGLNKRYTMPALSSSIRALRQSTGKPVTTTEEIDDYVDESLLGLGDWVFPNAHPYFHGQTEPAGAVTWTQAAYDDTVRRTNRFVLFKEVGLPTAGDPAKKLSERGQQDYYQKLENTNVEFVCFEAYDQPWKTHLPIEPHWGLFRADRTPKPYAAGLLASTVATPPGPAEAALYVYKDAGQAANHFVPSGKMGDTGDITIDPTFRDNPHSGITSLRVVYSVKGTGPNACEYAPPCKWAGLYWQEPANNWGKDPTLQGRGLDLSAFNRLRFWARADRPASIEFKVGGLIGPYGDSLTYPRGTVAALSTNWREFEIDLSGADLTHIIGGFAWVTNWEANPRTVSFYLDDIRFVAS